MTEKQYGGATGRGNMGGISNLGNKPNKITSNKKGTDREFKVSTSSPSSEQKILKAGKISSEVKKYARTITKKGIPLLEIAEKIESKIMELGGKPAFPVNLSINDIAAHYTPGHDDKTIAQGLLKIDLGVHVDGWVADTAFSLDLEDNEENKRLILSSEDALKAASRTIKLEVTNSEIGKMIEESISSGEISPIINLSGHGIDKYELHSGITIPNIDNHQDIPLKKGLYAIEPFTTNGAGSVRDGRPSGIYELRKPGSVRDNFAREVLAFIIEEYSTLPFCTRWIYKKFGARGLLALRQIESAGLLHHYTQLVEKGAGLVAQAEHTIIVTKDNVIVTTG